MNREGQSTLEMIVTLGLLFIVFTIALIAAYRKTVESNELKMDLDARRICQSLAYNIDTVAQQGSNYYRHIRIPRYLIGMHEYNLSVYGNYVEIMWRGTHGYRAYGLQVITNNTRVYCSNNNHTIIEKGLDKRLQIFNDNGTILITCERPDLRVISETFKPRVIGHGNFNISIDVINIGINDSASFSVTFNNSIIGNYSARIDSLEAGESKTATVHVAGVSPGNYTISIVVDSLNEIYESIEEDNHYNATIEVI
ncbi:MAG TPA: hypothetical protein ENF49_05290 [Candidatus Altiarchaeales archaeon]|nr:hypothetical protein [Candidatus Altiarchaeales archaeon]HEX55524.1 hypothetical protein [Candidatus Altiarchaeales archaeon]